MEKRIFLMVYLFCQTAIGLQAPYLYDAVSIGDTAVELTWRNNSTDYQGIIIMRKTGTIDQYTIVDTASGSSTSFKDSVISPTTAPYFYALTAYSVAEHSDTSNVDSIIVPPKPTDIFCAPQRLAVSWDTLTHCAHIQFYDSSTVETGYRIYKSTNFLAYSLIKDTVSSTPSSKGTIAFTDSSVFPNSWYRYFVDSYRGQQTFSTVTDTVFTFDLGAIERSIPRRCTISGKVSSFPVRYKGWCLKNGDTIILNETGVPDSTMFSIINVSNPKAIEFAGTGKSLAALFGKVSITKSNCIFGTSRDTLICYQYQAGTMTTASTARLPFSPQAFPGFLSDSRLLVRATVVTGISDLYLGGQYSFLDNNLSFVDTTQLLPATNIPVNYSTQGGITYQGRYFANVLFNVIGTGTDSVFEIADFGYYPVPKYLIHDYCVRNFPLIVDNILVDAPGLKNANNVFIDTAKNLAFAVSDTEMSVWNCQYRTGISHVTIAPHHSEMALRIGNGDDNCASVIFLPHHTQPATISLYGVSGRRVGSFGGIQGESFTWRHWNMAGVYVVNVMVDGKNYSTKMVLSK
jgi:hypothetical protein